MKSEIIITNKKGVAIIDIEGIIGMPENMQFKKPMERVATYEKFTESLDKISLINADEIVVNIRSTGGNVNDALLIYDALISLSAKVTTRCYGYVASAATIIAQAASEGCREISSNTLYLIHCSESSTEGNSRSMKAVTDMLDKTDERIAEIYAKRSGRDKTAFTELMNENNGKGKWLTAEEALSAGLVDMIISEDRNKIRPVTDSIEFSSMLDMLGLPDIPECLADLSVEADIKNNEATNTNRLAALWRMFLDFINIRSEGKEGKAGKSSRSNDMKANTTTGSVTNSLFDNSEVDKLRNAQNSAHRTTTKPKEDPSPTEHKRSANEEAYEVDVRNIIER